MTPAATATALDGIVGAAVVLSVLLVATCSLGRMVWLVALQAVVVSLAPLLVGLSLGAPHLVVGALLSVGIRGVAIPLALATIVRQSNVRVERHPYLGPRASATVAVVIVFLAARSTEAVSVTSAVASTRVLPAAIAVTLIGLLLIMTRRKALSAVVGLLVFDTGLTLAAFGLTYGMPFVVELGVLFDLLIAVAVVIVVSRRMLTEIGTLSTDHLRDLRG